jgi:hypothetical protein
MSNYTEIKQCRVGKSDDLVTVLNLGFQALTGIFPRSVGDEVTRGPLELVLSPSSGLLQLKHSFSATEMYGDNYGYRSGLNQSMVDHLEHKVKYLENISGIAYGDTVLDIGSNDATTLRAYRVQGLHLIGIDPTAYKFKEYYPDGIDLVADFFSPASYWLKAKKPAKIVTSIAMFYDLDDPVKFAQEIEAVLAEDGIWHFEQSYMPSMLRTNSYDTICHEHIEYYSLSIVKNILDKSGMKIIDVIMNGINGGSFAVTATKKNNSKFKVNAAVINWLLSQEDRMGLNTPKPFRDFEDRVFRHRDDLKRLIHDLVSDGKKVFGYGASTKGNVTLQFCGLTAKEIPVIAEVNQDKFGCITPGSHIPIISELEAKSMKPEYFLVLPWHFKDNIIRREKEYLAGGGRFIFPFPEIEIV